MAATLRCTIINKLVYSDLRSISENGIGWMHNRKFHLLRNSCALELTSRYSKKPRSNRTYLISPIGAIRWESTEKSALAGYVDPTTLPPIPTPPLSTVNSVVNQVDTEALATTVAEVLKEPSIATYGLGSWSPVGLVQKGLEFLHITCDLPWWGSIVVGTVVLRILVFPLVIISQRNSAKMNNSLPQLQVLQSKMTEARQSGNHLEVARLSHEMMIFMKEKDMNPLKNMLPPLAQAPLFISVFLGLRGMANAPVESFRTGGLFWFQDLTVPDQFYLLPLITSLTLAVTIEVGTDSARLSSANLGMMKYVFRAIPIIIFPFTLNFPGAILCYWVSSNFISLTQVAILRIPTVRDYFKIEPLIAHPKDALQPKKGFVKGFKESMTNMKITRELSERERFDSINFQRAGKAPIQRTFKYDPTKTRSTSEMLAKKRDKS